MRVKRNKILKAGLIFSTFMYMSAGVFFFAQAEAESVDNVFFETYAHTTFEYGYRVPEWAEDMCGIKLLTKGEGDTIAFKTELILQDNTQNDTLFQGLVLPQEIGAVDFHYLTITLTDCENKDVFLKIRGSYSKWGDYSSHWSVSTNDWQDSNLFYFMQTETGIVKSVKGDSAGGATLNSSFCGVSNTGKVSPFSISYDYEKKAIYAKTEHLGNVLVLDLDDEEMLGSNLVWNGFESGKVSLEISFTGIQTQACVIISNIGGYQLEGETLEDTKAPIIFVDKSQWTDSAPKGVVGIEYPLFAASAIDEIEGETPYNVCVYRTKNGKIIREYMISDGSFLPDETGTYTIFYTARDSNNFESVKEIPVDVLDVLAAPHIDFVGYGTDPESVNECFLGESFVFQRMESTGGSGKTIAEFFVLHNEEKVNDGYTFTAKETGVFEIVAQATDYLGRTNAFRREFTVISSSAPVITVKDMPAYFQGGKIYNLNYAEAKVFNEMNSEGIEVPYQTFLTINGQERLVKGNFVMPQTQARAKVTFKANYNGQESIEERTFTIVTPQKPVEYLQGTIQGVEYLENTAVFQVKENDYLDVITSLYNLTEVNLAILESNNLAIDLILKDSENFSRQLTITLSKGKKGLTKVVCGTQSATASGEFLYNVVHPCLISLSADGNIKDYTSGTLMQVSSYDDGSAFDMFSGHKVYVGFRFRGAGTLKILSLNGQSFHDVITDRTSPNLVVTGHVSDRAEKNQEVVLPVAYASDLLDPDAYVTLNVASPDGGYVLYGKNAAKETTFRATQYGRYTVTYIAQDESGNITRKVFSITVEDHSEPAIYIQGEVLSSYLLGSEMALPSARAYCLSGEVEVFVFVITPNGQVCIYSQGFTPSLRGKYIVRYYAKNGNDSYAMKDFTVEVA